MLPQVFLSTTRPPLYRLPPRRPRVRNAKRTFCAWTIAAIFVSINFSSRILDLTSDKTTYGHAGDLFLKIFCRRVARHLKRFFSPAVPRSEEYCETGRDKTADDCHRQTLTDYSARTDRWSIAHLNSIDTPRRQRRVWRSPAENRALPSVHVLTGTRVGRGDPSARPSRSRRDRFGHFFPVATGWFFYLFKNNNRLNMCFLYVFRQKLLANTFTLREFRWNWFGTSNSRLKIYFFLKKKTRIAIKNQNVYYV